MEKQEKIKAALMCVLIPAILSGLYSSSLKFGLTYLDDNVWVLDYHWYLLNISHWRQIFVQHDMVSGVFYRPLINLSFLLNAVIDGQQLFGYRFFNLFLHVINSLFIFILFGKLKYGYRLSLAAALIFAVHPVLTQAVVWIPGRTDSLLGFFIFPAFIFFLSYMESGRRRDLIFQGTFLLGALLTKESAVVFPLVCLVYAKFLKQESKQTPFTTP